MEQDFQRRERTITALSKSDSDKTCFSVEKPKIIKSSISSSKSDKGVKKKSESKAIKKTTNSKKTYKALIRKLPPRDYGIDDFRSAIERINEYLLKVVNSTDVLEVEHFIDGKIRYFD